MALPIMEAININRFELSNVVTPLDFSLLDLSFSPWDPSRFPMLTLAYRSIEASGSYPIAFNRANEIAVHLFLDGLISFPSIGDIVTEVLQADYSHSPSVFEDILSVDTLVSTRTGTLIERFRL